MTANDEGKRKGKVRIGMKQTMKVIVLGIAEEVFVAQDADPRIVNQIVEICEQRGIHLTRVKTMRELGRTCGIDVGAAIAALVVEE